MADYSVTITLTISITASTEEVAERRGDALQEAACKGVATVKGAWVGEIDDTTVEVEEA